MTRIDTYLEWIHNSYYVDIIMYHTIIYVAHNLANMATACNSIATYGRYI